MIVVVPTAVTMVPAVMPVNETIEPTVIQATLDMAVKMFATWKYWGFARKP